MFINQSRTPTLQSCLKLEVGTPVACISLFMVLITNSSQSFGAYFFSGEMNRSQNHYASKCNCKYDTLRSKRQKFRNVAQNIDSYSGESACLSIHLSIGRHKPVSTLRCAIFLDCRLPS